jgi:cholinesterase
LVQRISLPRLLLVRRRPAVHEMPELRRNQSSCWESQPPPNTSQARLQPVFQPTPDNVTMFADYVPLSYDGLVAELPYLNGNNDDEAGYYKIPACAQNVTLNASSWDEFNLEDFTCPTSTESGNRAAYDFPV